MIVDSRIFVVESVICDHDKFKITCQDNVREG